MRNTKQKNIIFEIIDNSFDHLSAYQVYELAKSIIPNISLGTIYRNLSCLCDEGKIRKLEFNNILRFDRFIKHSHFVCIECGNIIDIFDNFINDNKYINDNLVIDYDILFKGICKKCREGNGNKWN